ncbi:PAS domain S-box protein [Halocalculus aciditolerans]|uniref:histidine kinase n=1 Tax=Halocalculus aciditolerans TaxID=1383812 RepID=A0A830FEQ1_9EURY|nr:PAS domain S-box protein [Halocalculus aciditolerans]GGL67705.1 hypothetical protein GCM10009039_27110 [Halocalculus aciditolerans]
MSSTRSRYEAMCEASPDTIILVDADGRITYANDRVSEMFGYDPDDLVGDPVEVLVPEAVRDGHVAKRDAYLDAPETRPMGANLDLTGRRKDGTHFPVEVSLSPIDAGDDLEVMAAVRDRSDRRALRQKYQTILEAAPDPVFITDAVTREIVEVNEQATALLGYDADDLIGAPQTLLHPTGEEDTYNALFERHVAEQHATFTRLPDGSPICAETATGDCIPVEINARVFDLADHRLVAAVFRDVSARRERASQLAALHETTRSLMTADDPDCVARLVADAADSILAYTSTVVRLARDGSLQPVGVTDQAHAEMGDRPTYAATGDTPAGRTYAEQEPRQFDDVRDIDDDYDRGDARSAMYFPLGDHGVLCIVDPTVAAFDYGDVELASILAANTEAALDRLTYEGELERQNERLDNFASVVSHDLRNPLQVARGWLDIAQRDTDAPTDALDRVDAALDRMAAITDDTLTLAQQGRTVADETLVDVADLAASSWSTVDTGDARLHLTDDFRIRGDPDRLRHVLENLFRNSVEHSNTSPHPHSLDDSPDDPPSVTITVGPIDDHPDPQNATEPTDASACTGTSAADTSIRTGHSPSGEPTRTGPSPSDEPTRTGFFVADDGPGIPEGERDRVFEPGQTTAPDGTGFGLAIVKEIADAHGWTVRVTESESGGARFEFTGVTLVDA